MSSDTYAVDAILNLVRSAEDRRKSVSADELNAALKIITEAISDHWSTGTGTRLRRFVWSLWNGWHTINLYNFTGFDPEVGDAVILIFRAAIVGTLEEAHLRMVLTESGEMRRYEEAEKATPEGERVLYPHPAHDADELRNIAAAATALELRNQKDTE